VIELFPIIAEGCCDRFFGRPRSQNPYNLISARAWAEAWEWGWDEADFLLGVRGEQEARRWLGERAA
jgi:hypothetical protein